MDEPDDWIQHALDTGTAPDHLSASGADVVAYRRLYSSLAALPDKERPADLVDVVMHRIEARPVARPVGEVVVLGLLILALAAVVLTAGREALAAAAVLAGSLPEWHPPALGLAGMAVLAWGCERLLLRTRAGFGSRASSSPVGRSQAGP